MLFAIDRFNKEAPSGLEDPRYAEMSLREYVTARGYGRDMLDLYLAPMGSAVWSTPSGEDG
jgi:predicted NAD/FAD-binding protein